MGETSGDGPHRVSLSKIPTQYQPLYQRCLQPAPPKLNAPQNIINLLGPDASSYVLNIIHKYIKNDWLPPERNRFNNCMADVRRQICKNGTCPAELGKWDAEAARAFESVLGKIAGSTLNSLREYFKVDCKWRRSEVRDFISLELLLEGLRDKRNLSKNVEDRKFIKDRAKALIKKWYQRCNASASLGASITRLPSQRIINHLPDFIYRSLRGYLP